MAEQNSSSSNTAGTERGFSLIEVVITFAILAIATTALGLVEISNARRTQDLKVRDIGFARAQAFMERIQRIPFGTPNAPASAELTDPGLRVTPENLDTLFGTDADVSQITLTQLERLGHTPVSAESWEVSGEPLKFTLSAVEDAGDWEVLIDQDLDGNGIIESKIGEVETREGLPDVLRIEIRRNGKTVLRTIRARPPDGGGAGE